MTTDVTLGAYLGVRKRLSRRDPVYVTIPLVLGLSFINLNDNTVSSTAGEQSSEVVPGWTWSTGMIFQIDRFNAGIVLGRDYASGVGSNWLYNNETWYSFAIGYSFLK